MTVLVFQCISVCFCKKLIGDPNKERNTGKQVREMKNYCYTKKTSNEYSRFSSGFALGSIHHFSLFGMKMNVIL